MNFIDNVDVEKYNNFLKSSEYCNIFQTTEWAEVKSETWNFKRVALVDNGNICATAQILVRNGLWYIARGPILDYSNELLLRQFLEELKKYAHSKGAKLVKIDIPEIAKRATLISFKEEDYNLKKDDILNIFASQGFTHQGFTLNMSDTIQPRFEVVTQLEDNIVDKFPKDTRRLIRDADKKFVKVKQIGIDKIDDFLYAIECTEKRKGISLRNREYFEKLFRLYKDNCLVFVSYINIDEAIINCKKNISNLDNEIIMLKEKSPKKKRQLEEQKVSVNKLLDLFTELYDEGLTGERIISSSFTLVYGSSAEMIYAGMDARLSKLPAQYKVYAETMQKAYSLGVKNFSTGGIEGSLNDNLLLFKSKFNPDIVEHYGEFDYSISKLYKFMYDYGLPLRRKFLKLLKK
ncbi:peptidoglycan bridge formation glycyltransferase FemA/FemB family protein [Gemella sp. GH3]|uniref:lipid II:glycine glycyltransferase FemX n=1 Tax=unclassified Gemella TaxID=2624949 RepID=UPI0015CFBB11|nr:MULTISPECIES: peptidoglycan bridge formation glycyltransferase FemA/FemB family protein [unclassified Gemella]MBF0713952.1 peptidoglycan bridge formation glycyltransferase FemA/FemB family protein [Gemella sp. GH3.1]NYS50904.1 peptidoglycan bridge formation glycyltransferase FemA/FemB family protein [Gemella sp. GH3]